MTIPHVRRLLLSLILCLAAFVRIYNLGTLPPGFYSDEASIAYDAYSILHTARDRSGSFLPIYARGVGFWAAALPCYMEIPSLALFGLNEFAARLPSAICGVLTMLLTYLLVRRRIGWETALWAALLLALSPWHVHISRIGCEYSALPFFITLGLYLFARGLTDGDAWLPLSACAFGLAIYTYIPARIFVPTTIGGILWIYRGRLKGRRPAIIMSALLLGLLIFPTLLFAIREPEHFLLRLKQIPLGAGGRSLPAMGMLYLKNHIAHLSPRFLFLGGDANMRNFPRGFGQLYLFELPLAAAGVLACVKKRRSPDARFLIFWLITFPIASSLTIENIPHGLRSVTAIPLFEILSAVGISSLISACNSAFRARRLFMRAALTVYAACAAGNIAVFMHHYFTAYPIYAARQWDYGWREALGYARGHEGEYDRIVLTVLSIGPPTVYPPFYLRCAPAEYQQYELKRTKYSFVPPEIMPALAATFKGRSLYVVRQEELPGLPPTKTIQFPDGGTAFKIIERLNR